LPASRKLEARDERTDGETDEQTDEVQRLIRPPTEGRIIIIVKIVSSPVQHYPTFYVCRHPLQTLYHISKMLCGLMWCITSRNLRRCRPI